MSTFLYTCTAHERQEEYKINHIYHILARKIRDMRMVLRMQSQFHPKDDLDK